MMEHEADDLLGKTPELKTLSPIRKVRRRCGVRWLLSPTSKDQWRVRCSDMIFKSAPCCFRFWEWDSVPQELFWLVWESMTRKVLLMLSFGDQIVVHKYYWVHERLIVWRGWNKPEEEPDILHSSKTQGRSDSITCFLYSKWILSSFLHSLHHTIR